MILEDIKISIALYLGNINQGYSYAKNKLSWQKAFLTVLTISLISTLISLYTSLLYKGKSLALIGNSVFITFIVAIISSAIIISVGLITATALYHILLKIVGGKASFKDTLKFFLFTIIFPTTIRIATSFIPQNKLFTTPLNWPILLPYLIFEITLIIWAIIINTEVFSNTHKISKKRSFTAVLILFLIITTILLSSPTGIK